jgi:dihydrofolate reductase
MHNEVQAIARGRRHRHTMGGPLEAEQGQPIGSAYLCYVAGRIARRTHPRARFNPKLLRRRHMTKVRVNGFSISLDGFGAGPSQSIEEPLGVGGEQLHEWMFKTRTFQAMYGKERGETGLDDDFVKRGFENAGAWILGRNMFGPVRGSWPDDSWKGWWGDNPPYHNDVFVLTHHARKPVEMEGGTVFHFVTDGIHSALEKAKASAKGKDVRIGGGASTVRQYLQAGLIDEMHLAVSPVLLGSGEPLLSGIDLPALGFERAEYVGTPKAAHYVLKRKS